MIDKKKFFENTNMKFVEVFVDEKGNHAVRMPSGEIIPNVQLTIVEDGVNEVPIVTVKMLCKLADSKDLKGTKKPLPEPSPVYVPKHK